MMGLRSMLCLGALALAGCSSRATDILDGLEDVPPPRSSASAQDDAAPPPLALDGGAVTPAVEVDAWGLTTKHELVHVWHDGVTLHVDRVGAVSCGLPQEQVYELAQSGAGELLGTTPAHLVRIDPVTAACKVLAPLSGLPGPVSALALLPAVMTPDGKDRLVGLTDAGIYLRIEPNGMVSPIGALTPTPLGAFELPGDMAVVRGRLLVSVRAGAGPDMGIYEMSHLDGKIAAAVVPSTGLYQLWGLGARGGHLTLFTGFSGGPNVLDLDLDAQVPKAGPVSPTLDTSVSFYAGASRPSM